jgi:hypothetical protein
MPRRPRENPLAPSGHNDPLVEAHLLLEEVNRNAAAINKLVLLAIINGLTSLLLLLTSYLKPTEDQEDATVNGSLAHISMGHYLTFMVRVYLITTYSPHHPLNTLFPSGIFWGCSKHKAFSLRGQQNVSREAIDLHIQSLKKHTNSQSGILFFLKGMGLFFSFLVPLWLSFEWVALRAKFSSSQLDEITSNINAAVACVMDHQQLSSFEVMTQCLPEMLLAQKMIEMISFAANSAQATTNETGALIASLNDGTWDPSKNQVDLAVLIQIYIGHLVVLDATLPTMHEFSISLICGSSGFFIGIIPAVHKHYYNNPVVSFFASYNSLSMFQFLYQCYVQRNSTMKLEMFENTLNKITGPKTWKNVSPKNALNSTVFQIALNEPKITIGSHPTMMAISRDLYILLLYQLGCSWDMTVNTTGEGNLLVGYKSLSSAQATRFQEQFQQKLVSLIEANTTSQKAIEKLNQLNQHFHSANPWRVDIDYLSSPMRVRYYCAYKSHLSTQDNCEKYANILRAASHENSIFFSSSHIAIVSLNLHRLTQELDLLSQSCESSKFSQVSSSLPDRVTAVRRRQGAKPSPGAACVVEECADPVEKSCYPQSIDFGQGITYQKDGIGLAYPLYIAWLRDYATKEVIDGTLQTGTTHGRKAAVSQVNSAKGIQSKQRLYRDVTGQWRISALMIKLPNNSGIFGRIDREVETPDGRKRALVVFDGVCYRRH